MGWGCSHAAGWVATGAGRAALAVRSAPHHLHPVGVHPRFAGQALVGVAHPLVFLGGDVGDLVDVRGASAVVVEEVNVDAVDRAEGHEPQRVVAFDEGVLVQVGLLERAPRACGFGYRDEGGNWVAAALGRLDLDRVL